jgi:hypothetical protein
LLAHSRIIALQSIAGIDKVVGMKKLLLILLILGVFAAPRGTAAQTQADTQPYPPAKQQLFLKLIPPRPTAAARRLLGIAISHRQRAPDWPCP